MKKLTLEEAIGFCECWQLHPRIPKASQMKGEVEEVGLMMDGMGCKASKKDILVALNKRRDKNIEIDKMIREERNKVRKEMGLPPCEEEDE